MEISSFFLMSRDSTWNLIVDLYSSGGNKGHETTQFLYKKHPQMAVMGWWCEQESVLVDVWTSTSSKVVIWPLYGIDEILQPFVVPYAGVIGDSFLFMDDNAHPHRAGLVDEMLEDEGIEHMQWPASSPDLSNWAPPTTVPQLQITHCINATQVWGSASHSRRSYTILKEIFTHGPRLLYCQCCFIWHILSKLI